MKPTTTLKTASALRKLILEHQEILASTPSRGGTTEQAVHFEWEPVEVFILPEQLIHDRCYSIEEALALAKQMKKNLQKRWGRMARVTIDKPDGFWGAQQYLGANTVLLHPDAKIHGHQYEDDRDCEHPILSDFPLSGSEYLFEEDSAVEIAAKQLGYRYKRSYGLIDIFLSYQRMEHFCPICEREIDGRADNE